ncbi:hypothetical protein ES703_58155 [subsurface metagenome]
MWTKRKNKKQSMGVPNLDDEHIPPMPAVKPPRGSLPQMLKNPSSMLKKLLAREPELAAKLVEALETDRYFITISCQKKYEPDDQHDLQHYWMQRGYNKNDVMPSLKHLAADFIAKENPTADLPDKNGWH